MDEKRLLQVVGGGGISPYAWISSMMAASARRNAHLTAEERAERKERRRLSAVESARRSKVIKNICPDCEGKLIRGKKDKKNDYKRVWSCKDCGSSHTA